MNARMQRLTRSSHPLAVNTNSAAPARSPTAADTVRTARLLRVSAITPPGSKPINDPIALRPLTRPATLADPLIARAKSGTANVSTLDPSTRPVSPIIQSRYGRSRASRPADDGWTTLWSPAASPASIGHLLYARHFQRGTSLR